MRTLTLLLVFAAPVWADGEPIRELDGGPAIWGRGGDVGGLYIETFESWSPVAAGIWQPINLGGFPFKVPGGAVVEVAIRNDNNSNARHGGLRAFGSSFDRRFQLHKAEGGGSDLVVLHVQTDPAARIEYWAEDPSDIDFVLLGYWVAGEYVERNDTFKAGADSGWTDRELLPFGVAPGSVAEIVLANSSTNAERLCGVRTNGSSLQRIVDIHEAESGGLDALTMFVEADPTDSATIELYAEADADVDFRLVGYWSVAPLDYKELAGNLGGAFSDATWEGLDLTDFGVPDDAVAEVAPLTSHMVTANEMGVRGKGSTLGRVLDLHEAQDGGGELFRTHAVANGDATIEIYHADVSDPHTFYLLGYWEHSNFCTAPADCDDANVCTNDACQGSRCTYTNNTAACDEDICLEGQSCSEGVCIGGTAVDTDDDTVEDCSDNCVDVANTDQQDLDGDLLGDVCDCAPLDPFNEPPPELGNTVELGKNGDETMILWSGEVEPGPFNVYRGHKHAGEPLAYNHLCFASSVAGTSATDADRPFVYRVFYYLVEREACGPSGLGSSSYGALRPNDDPCPGSGLDSDGDGTDDALDNCPVDPNGGQEDADADNYGDLCDGCPQQNDPLQQDVDDDGPGDICDNCPETPNSSQLDQDGDSIGDACDWCPLDSANDTDGDGVCGDVDNCPNTPNDLQEDQDADTMGDLCDPCAGNPDPGCVACPPGSDPDGDGFCDAGVPIEEGTTTTYLANTVSPGVLVEIGWYTDGYVPGQHGELWLDGAYGVGFDDNGSANNLIATEVATDSGSIYTLTTINVADVAVLKQVAFSADYDDGYILWINGTEVVRSPEMPGGTPTWVMQVATHESSNGSDPDYGEPVNVTSLALASLTEGPNSVAIGVWNETTDSPDLVLVPRLSLSADNCPLVANPGQADSDGDGVGDVCE